MGKCGSIAVAAVERLQYKQPQVHTTKQSRIYTHSVVIFIVHVCGNALHIGTQCLICMSNYAQESPTV